MFENLKAAGALANLMRNKDGLQAAVKRVQDGLEAKRIMCESGGGAVKVTVNGRMKVIDVSVDPALYKSSDGAALAMANQIVVDAMNKAISQAQQVAAKEISREAEAMGLPTGGLEKLLS